MSFLYAANVEEVAPEDVVQPLVAVLVGVTLTLVAATLVLRDARRAAVVTSALVAFFFGYGHLSVALGPAKIAARWQVLGWLIVVALALVIAMRLRDRLRRVTTGLNVAATVLVVMSLVTIVPYELSGFARGGAATGPVTATGAGSGGDRDIYYLVFDRYGSEWAFQRHFGLASNDLPGWLSDRGFFVASESRANYGTTALSLASSLNMTHLEELAQRYGVDTKDLGPSHQMVQRNGVAATLKARGYRFLQVGSWWAPTQRSTIADATYTWTQDSEFSAVLRDTTVLPLVSRRLGLRDIVPFRERHARIGMFQFQKLRELRNEPGPKFVFAHILLPHQPYTFAADGRILTDEELARWGLNRKFAAQLAYTNSQIKLLVDELLQGPESTRPIVIVQADEGPRPLREDVDWSKRPVEGMRIRYEILNALYLPGQDRAGLYPSLTPVNTFRLIFARYFGADLPLLPDRSYAWSGREHVYDFVDITDYLRAPPDAAVEPPRGQRGPAIPP